jgi:hypothetical protein
VNAFSAFPIVSIFVLHTLLFITLALSREEANRDQSLGRSFTIIFLCLQASHYSYPHISAATAFRKVPGTMACYYARNASVDSCDQTGHSRMWMLGNRASPKERLCCIPCATWLRSNDMADPVDGMGQCVLANCGRPYHIVLFVGPNASTGSFAIRLVWRSLFGMCVFFLVWHICLL